MGQYLNYPWDSNHNNATNFKNKYTISSERKISPKKEKKGKFIILKAIII